MKLEDRIQTLGKELFSDTTQSTGEPSWLDRLIEHGLHDQKFRIQVLRFIDVLPRLNNDADLTRHLQQYFGKLKMPFPELTQWGLTQSDKPWLSHIVAPLVRLAVHGFSRKYMGGSTIHAATNTIKKLHKNGMSCSLDILGEASISEKEAKRYQQAYLKMIPAMSMQMKQWRDTKNINNRHSRNAPVLNISLKISSLYSQTNPVNLEHSINRIKHRLYPILECARENHAFVLLDMEQYSFKNITLQTFIGILNEPAFKTWPDIGLAIQAYLKDSYQDLCSIYDVLQKRKMPATIRLVRGAYWDYESITAEQNNWPLPVWHNKQDTDANYELCLNYLLSKHPIIKTAVATHNRRSIVATIAMAEKYKLSNHDFEFQMLYGMAEALKTRLIKYKYPLRIYVPYGEALPGMAYLVRRLLENSSDQRMPDIRINTKQAFTLDKPEFFSIAEKHPSKIKPFRNQALHRFTETAERDNFQQAILKCQSKLGKDYPLIINGTHHTSNLTIRSINPAMPEQTIGNVFVANQALADKAIASAKNAHQYWSKLHLSERAVFLRSIAKLLQQQRLEFSAWLILEAGKNWQEADADICEAIDFLNYYAQQAENLENQAGNLVSGETNYSHYHSRGTALIIAPWNFPLAILVGMLSAAIVSGNTAILKPSSQTPVIAARFITLLHEAGLPDGVVNLITGSGNEIGEYLAKQTDIHIIAFTGSMATGTRLIKIASQLNPGQTHIKRVIAEMGGKNAIIIDNDADLDVAVTGTVSSAFSYQGQKCSAASRVIVLNHIYQKFMERLLEATQSIKVGAPEHPENIMGPVISDQAYNHILAAIKKGKTEANLLLPASPKFSSHGFFISPTIFTEVNADSMLAQKEIFGPVLSVFRANNFSHALALANNSQYALTGAVYSRSPLNLQRAKTEFNVGNLYLNRKTTGAVVSRQPFGGYKLSGLGYKTGGKNYLMQFMDESFITENTMRCGFAPTDKDNGDADALH